MTRMYSRRLLLPYAGVIQVAEMGRARALSLDGDRWAIQYSLLEPTRERGHMHVADPGSNYSRVAGFNHTLVGTVIEGRLESHPIHPLLDPEEVRSACHRLVEELSHVRMPFPAADRYEYWLLDSRDERPLALLGSSVDEQDLAFPPPRPTWLAMPAAELDVPAPEPPQDTYIPPVNYRLQKAVEKRAGTKPRALWFDRSTGPQDDFPPCLIREDWDDEEQHLLCELYLRRLAPRLLMMEGLAPPVRHRLEEAARAYVFDVERFHPLYPEVVDTRTLTAARVEARMRRANS